MQCSTQCCIFNCFPHLPQRVCCRPVWGCLCFLRLGPICIVPTTPRWRTPLHRNGVFQYFGTFSPLFSTFLCCSTICLALPIFAASPSRYLMLHHLLLYSCSLMDSYFSFTFLPFPCSSLPISSHSCFFFIRLLFSFFVVINSFLV